MRRLLLFFALSAALNAAEINFTTGQAARLVMGQATFTAQQPGASATLLGAVGGIAYANDTLFVVDSNRLGATPVNHRVLLFKNISASLPAPADELPVSSARCQVCVGVANVVLGQPDFTTAELKPAAADKLRSPGGVATDGNVLVVADTDNNRVLIWHSIPQFNGQPANVVVGQPDFSRAVANDGGQFTPTRTGLRGPQGVWIQNGRLFVADTGNNRVLIWNSIPRQNHQPADLVLGTPDFTTFIQPDLLKAELAPKANTLLSPSSVTSDGIRLYVSDLGHNRVLIWNSIPTQNQQPADVVVGQPDMESGIPNNVRQVCDRIADDSSSDPLYPDRCSASLDFPRFALSDGTYLFIADGGNDRILVFNSIPTTNGARADAVLGQIRDTVNLVSDSAFPDDVASSGVVRTPHALAWDGRNLYATDTFNRRVMVFTMAERKVPNTGVRNTASREIYAVGTVTLTGEVKENDEVTVKIAEREYKYKAGKDDKFNQVVTGLVTAINAGEGDPNVLASPNFAFATVLLTARAAGAVGNSVTFSASVSSGATIVTTTSGASLSGGQDAAKLGPGTAVSLFGDNLSDVSAGAPPDAQVLPRELGGVQVYFDGIRAPLYSVSPMEIRAQIPVEVFDAQSINAYVRTVRQDGSISVASAVAVPIVRQNPGLFAQENVPDPRPAIAFHGSSHATGTISVDGSANAGDVATVTIEDRRYSYTVQSGDTLASIRDALIERINADPKVQAFAAAAFTRIRLQARIAGPEGNGIPIAASSVEGNQVILTATNSTLCCANVKGAPITVSNPAIPGETIILLATGLGLVKPEEARQAQRTGVAYDGPELNDPLEFVSSLAGGKTANVLAAGLKPGTVGIYEVVLELNSDLPTNHQTQLTIAQDIYVSNIVSIPVFNPVPANSP
jgi:uncharacterized protein (TIGR03437 family)